jgi:hypothetical protein
LDHEPRPESDLGDTENEHTEAAGLESSTSDLGSESALLSDSWSTAPTPPEWPAVDLGNTPAAAADENAAPDESATTDAATPAEDTAELADPGDDSDAPVQLDDDGIMRGENVNLSQGGVKSIEATNVTFSQGGAGQVRAEQMSMEQGGVGLARVENLTLGSGASAFAVVADQATVEEGSNTFLVIAKTLSGDVRPTVDWRGAMAFGAGLGLVLSILRRIR